MADGEDKKDDDELKIITDEEPQGSAVDVDDEDDGDEPKAGDSKVGGTDDDREELRASRRDERKERKERQRNARERDSKELNFLRNWNGRLENENAQLRSRVGQIEQRVGGTEVAAIDNGINDIKSKIKLAEQVMAKAMEASKGDDFSEALSIRDKLRDDLGQLTQAREQFSRRSEGQNQQAQQAAPDTRLVGHAQAFVNDHQWWDPNGGDEDSLIVSAIDNALIREGMDPRQKEYWDELRTRVKRRLPDKFKANAEGDDDEEETPQNGNGRRPGGPTFRTGGRERPLKKGEVYISKERREAMEEAGVWEDPVLRKRYLKSYAAFDQNSRA